MADPDPGATSGYVARDSSHPLILGDWGVSSCRLHLVVDERLRDGTTGPGMGSVIDTNRDPATVFRELTQVWRTAHPDIATILCGTVASNIGWVDPGYVPAPAGLSDIAAHAHVRNTVTFLPGVRTTANAFGSPDVMRSEDIQALGWCAKKGLSDALLCCPGTHTKWVEVEDARIDTFTTGYAGEPFAVLREHSLLRGADGPPEISDAFHAGVDHAAHHPAPISGLFTIRALTATNALSPAAARDRLSGYLIGADCAAMLRAWGHPPDAIIGDGGVASAYAAALARLGHAVPVASGQDAVLAGLRRIARLVAD